MLKNVQIIFAICVAILFKLSFYNIAFFVTTNSLATELITKHEVFKVGKKRRRTLESSYQLIQTFHSEEQLIAENEELEDKKEFLKKFKLPLFTLLTDFRSILKQILDQNNLGTAQHSVADAYPLSVKKHLSISILRI